MERLKEFFLSLKAAMQPMWEYDLIIGIDSGDPLLDKDVGGWDFIDITRLTRESCNSASIYINYFTNLPPGSICRMWNDLAQIAFVERNCDFVVLVGDDVILTTPFAQDIFAAFDKFEKENGTPFGFGCVSFCDDTFPGFPTFPVVHRLHSDIFGNLLPDCFVNQGADPFIFQIYRAFNCASMAPNARLENHIGGAQEARYTKQDIDWSGNLLFNARSKAYSWLNKQEVVFQPVITLDVIVPSYRAPLSTLQTILSLKFPRKISVQFIIIFDNPSEEVRDICMQIECINKDNPFVRVRQNRQNLGASASRNRGLAESSSDWVLFLDDDVIPDDKIITEYATCISNYPEAIGFVGLTRIPAPTNALQAGVIMAGVTFFWSAAQIFPERTEIPWGVTANLCSRRTAVRFDESYPHTGGGEDIDYCLNTAEYLRGRQGFSGFVVAPTAIASHPWWDNGKPHCIRFYKWATGDGYLNDKFRDLTYRTSPNLVEAIILATAFFLIDSLRTFNSFSCCNIIASASFLCVNIFFFALADLLTESYIHFVESNASMKNLPLKTRAAGLFYSLKVRVYSDSGRLVGHLGRGRVLQNFLVRFNWFGKMPEAIKAKRDEKWQACRRSVVRLLLSLFVLKYCFCSSSHFAAFSLTIWLCLEVSLFILMKFLSK